MFGRVLRPDRAHDLAVRFTLIPYFATFGFEGAQVNAMSDWLCLHCTEPEAEWLVNEAINTWERWQGPAALHALMEQKFASGNSGVRISTEMRRALDDPGSDESRAFWEEEDRKRDEFYERRWSFEQPRQAPAPAPPQPRAVTPMRRITEADIEAAVEERKKKKEGAG